MKNIQKRIDRIDAIILKLELEKKKLMSQARVCNYFGGRTGQKVKCKTCGNAEYIFCKLKNRSINENLCNAKCENYKP